MARASSIEPVVGDWYASHGERFEVVAVDEDDRTAEVQYADGTLAEIDLDDWSLRSQAGGLRLAEPPENAAGSEDVDPDEDSRRSNAGSYDDEASLRASGLEELDLFE